MSGQYYLNTEYSRGVIDKTRDTKGGEIKLYKISEHQLKESPDYKNVQVGDSHHRFVWGAYQGKTLKAKLLKLFMGGKPISWRELKYQHDPKEEFTFDVKGLKSTHKDVKERAQAKLEKVENVKTKLYMATLSPELSGFDTKPEEFIQQQLKVLWPDVIVEKPELDKLTKYLRNLWSKSNVKALPKMVDELVAAALDKEVATVLGESIKSTFKSGTPPNVAFGDAKSIGYYEPKSHVIILDPKKNKTADEKLDTLAFEVGNSARREDFRRKEESTTNVEFKTMEGYINMLLSSTKSKDIVELVSKLGIEKSLCKTADASTVLKGSPPELPMPSESVLGTQKLRSALAWYMMKDWAPKERELYFATSAHGKGMKATQSEYSN